MPTNIVAIGGGAGTFNVLYGIKRNLDYNISAIISVADNGGTTGAIRDKYGILPPGDFRRAIAALAGDTDIVRKLFEYSFKDEEGVIGGNKIGNILFTALVDISGGNVEKAIDTMGEMFDIRGRVIPVTLEDVNLAAKFEDGTIVHGEKNIDVSDKNDFERAHNIDQNIVDAWLEGAEGNINPRAREAIINADYVIIGPGDLYTSIVPNLLCKGMREALHASSAKLIYICNAMTKRGETTNMEVIDFIDTIEKYLYIPEISQKRSIFGAEGAPQGAVSSNTADEGAEGQTKKTSFSEISPLDYVIVNNGHISEEVAEKYKKEENKRPLKVKDYSLFEGKGYKIIERDIVNDADYVRHNPLKLAKILEDIVGGWIQ